MADPDESRARRRPLAVTVAVALAVSLADIATKAILTRSLDWGEQRWLIDGWVGLEMTRNRGIAFGLGNGSWLIALLVIAGFVTLIWFIMRSDIADSPIGAVAFGLAVGGATGNLVDRLLDGAVTDFFVLGPWPRFNVADSALTVGLIALAIIEIREHGGYQGV